MAINLTGSAAARSTRRGGGGWTRYGMDVLLMAVLLHLGSAGGVAAQWVERPGEGWAHLSLIHHDTRDRFDYDGVTTPFFAGGHAVTTSLILTAAVGLFSGVDAWVQLPVHRLRFRDAAGVRERTGAGDPRIYLRAAASLLPWLSEGGVPLALRGGVKLPNGDFPIDSEIIPLGEGQRDWELMLEVGHSFHPRPLYVMGWAGRRFREGNEETGQGFGDENFMLVAAGGTLGIVDWKMSVEGWRGDVPTIEGLRIATARREMIQLLPTVHRTLGPGDLEIGARLPLSGRNLPAKPAVTAGYFFRWSVVDR